MGSTDDPSARPMNLDRLMRQALVELEMLAAPRAGQPHYGSKSDSDHAGPPFVPDIVGYWRRRYESLDNDEARRSCVEGVLDEIRAVKFSKRADVDSRTRSGRLLVGADPRPLEVVCHVYGYSERQVHRLRAEARLVGLRAA